MPYPVRLCPSRKQSIAPLANSNRKCSLRWTLTFPYRNAVVLAVPSIDGLDAARNQIVDYLAWQAVQDVKRSILYARAPLVTNVNESNKRMPEAIRQAYCIVVTISERNEVTSFRMTSGGQPLFTTIAGSSKRRSSAKTCWWSAIGQVAPRTDSRGPSDLPPFPVPVIR